MDDDIGVTALADAEATDAGVRAEELRKIGVALVKVAKVLKRLPTTESQLRVLKAVAILHGYDWEKR